MKCSAHFAVGVGSLAFWLKYNYSGHIKHSPSDWSIGAMPKPSIREGMDELLLTVEQAGAFNSFNPSECLSAMILLYCDYHCCKLWPRSAWLISQNVLVSDRTHPPPHDLLHLCLLHTFVTPSFFKDFSVKDFSVLSHFIQCLICNNFSVPRVPMCPQEQQKLLEIIDEQQSHLAVALRASFRRMKDKEVEARFCIAECCRVPRI